MVKDLIFDVGGGLGYDSSYYLERGYRVVCIDANPLLIDQIKSSHSQFIKRNKLTAINKAITSRSGDVVPFHLSKNAVWSSLHMEIANRNGLLEQTIEVGTCNILDLFDEFGVPFYCKIDIEGADDECLRSMMTHSLELPMYISVESECSSFNNHTSGHERTTLDLLHKMGYRAFKLVDQNTLRVLDVRIPFYRRDIKARILRKTASIWNKITHQTGKYQFRHGSSGPFGSDLQGRWLNYASANRLLKQKRQEYFRFSKARDLSFWCDWHARL